jgi:hypothetical protein
MSNQPYKGKPHKVPGVAATFMGDTPNRSQRLCKVCGGMPWARTETRLTDTFDPVAIHGFCRGCDEPYAPEPPLKGEPVLGSSAGIAIQASDIHGQERYHAGARNDNARRRSRAKFG